MSAGSNPARGTLTSWPHQFRRGYCDGVGASAAFRSRYSLGFMVIVPT